MKHAQSLKLTHGQVLYALADGLEPSQKLKDNVRYLRQLGIPFAEDNTGRGNRLTYGFLDLMELGIAIEAIRNGTKTKTVATCILDMRKKLRKLFTDCFAEIPEVAFKEDWVKSRGAKIVLHGSPLIIGFPSRFEDAAPKLEWHFGDSLLEALKPFAVQRNGEVKPAINVTKRMIELVAWAEEAPVKKTGPKKE